MNSKDTQTKELIGALKELLECDYTSGTHLYCAQERAKKALEASPLASSTQEVKTVADIIMEDFNWDYMSDPGRYQLFHDLIRPVAEAYASQYLSPSTSVPYVTLEDLAITASEMGWHDDIMDIIKKLVRP